jgi:hypothetical protein
MALGIGADADAGFVSSGGIALRWVAQCHGRRQPFLFSVLPGGAVELPGRSRPAPSGVALRSVLASALTTLGAVTRAREAAAGSGELRCRPTCTARLSGAASTSRFSEIVVHGFGVDDGARAIGADADVGSPGRGGGDGAGAGPEGREVRGHRQRSLDSATPAVVAAYRGRRRGTSSRRYRYRPRQLHC